MTSLSLLAGRTVVPRWYMVHFVGFIILMLNYINSLLSCYFCIIFFKINFFKKILSDKQSGCQTVWTQIRHLVSYDLGSNFLQRLSADNTQCLSYLYTYFYAWLNKPISVHHSCLYNMVAAVSFYLTQHSGGVEIKVVRWTEIQR